MKHIEKTKTFKTKMSYLSLSLYSMLTILICFSIILKHSLIIDNNINISTVAYICIYYFLCLSKIFSFFIKIIVVFVKCLLREYLIFLIGILYLTDCTFLIFVTFVTDLIDQFNSIQFNSICVNCYYYYCCFLFSVCNIGLGYDVFFDSYQGIILFCFLVFQDLISYVQDLPILYQFLHYYLLL